MGSTIRRLRVYQVSARHRTKRLEREASDVRQAVGNRSLLRLLGAFSAVNLAEWAFVTALSIYAYRVGGALAGLGLIVALGVGFSGTSAFRPFMFGYLAAYMFVLGLAPAFAGADEEMVQASGATTPMRMA